MFETISMEVDARGVAHVTLNRPDKHNAMSADMIAEMAMVARQIEADRDVRVVVLTGAGRSFCAGGDLGWMRAQRAASENDRRKAASSLAAMLGALNSLSKPVLARVHGSVFGGGVGLCCVCDKVFADHETKFGLTETKLGLIPATIGPYVIARMGAGRARQVFMSSRTFDAEQAVALGIASFVGNAQEVDNELENEVLAYLRCAPAAVADAKAMTLDFGGAPSQEQIDASIDALMARWAHEEAEQGLAAFFDKVDPPWA